MNPRTCPRCKETKDISEFPRNRTRKDGVGGFCKTCSNAAKKKTITEHRDAYLAGKQQYYQSHKQQHQEYQERYEQEHRDEITEWRKQYRQENKERDSLYKRIYHALNPLRRRIHEHNRRTKKRESNGTFTTQDVDTQYKRQKGKCYWCGVRVGKDYHIDHITPLARGGTNDASNIVIACPHCNLSKSDKLPHEWQSPIRRLL